MASATAVEDPKTYAPKSLIGQAAKIPNSANLMGAINHLVYAWPEHQDRNKNICEQLLRRNPFKKNPPNIWGSIPGLRTRALLGRAKKAVKKTQYATIIELLLYNVQLDQNQRWRSAEEAKEAIKPVDLTPYGMDVTVWENQKGRAGICLHYL